MLVDFASGARAMLELGMYAESSRYQEEISAVGARGKIECLVPGPGRFWPTHLGAAPTPQWQVEVTLVDGWKAVAMGLAAQLASRQGAVIPNPLDAALGDDEFSF